MADEKTKKQDEEILDTAKERFKNAQDAWNDPYREALDDLKFRAGEQWPQ
jgi:hypothetical protein